MIAETDDVTVTRFALTVDPSRQWVRVLRLTASGDRGDLERAFSVDLSTLDASHPIEVEFFFGADGAL